MQQESVVGPLLFILCVNDLPEHSKASVLDLFAGDRTMTASNVSLQIVTDFLNADLADFYQLYVDHKMVVVSLRQKHNSLVKNESQ